MPKEKTKEFKASTYSLDVEVLKNLKNTAKKQWFQKQELLNELLLSTLIREKTITSEINVRDICPAGTA